MRVLRAKSAGFCWGVRRAVVKAREVVAHTAGHPVYSDGPLIHNRQMMGQLAAEGILETDRPAALPQDSTLIIRAHGIAPERRRELKALPLRLEDATCPDVARIQAQVRKYARQGWAVLIFGDAGHAEVEGLLGHAGPLGRVVECPGDVARLPDLHHVCLVSQSTQYPEEFAAMASAVRKRYPEALVLDTICDSTRRRQEELERIAALVDVIVVVGGSHSANTLRLVRLAATLKPTVHIETEHDIERKMFAPYTSVGLTAGASTPEFVIDAVERCLQAF